MALGQLFSQRVGYAVYALCYMARKAPDGGLTAVPELSEWMRGRWPAISETYLASVIQRLVRGGVLISRRGVSGGYSLARRPEQITLLDVITSLEGSFHASCPLAPTGECPAQDHCGSYQKLVQIQHRYADMLAEVTIAELATDVHKSVEKPDVISDAVI